MNSYRSIGKTPTGIKQDERYQNRLIGTQSPFGKFQKLWNWAVVRMHNGVNILRPLKLHTSNGYSSTFSAYFAIVFYENL